MVSGSINSACGRFWSSTLSLVQDCLPRRVRDDMEPIVPQDDPPRPSSLMSRLRLARLSGAVCGIEFCYAAETAFVSPVLLRIGIQPRFMTLIWCLSPLLGLFLMPLLGSASDRCKSRFGRRRPFIVLLAIGSICGLLLVPYGWPMGQVCGISAYRPEDQVNATATAQLTSNYQPGFTSGTGMLVRESPADAILSPADNLSQSSADSDVGIYVLSVLASNESSEGLATEPDLPVAVKACGMAFTIIGVMMLDFNCDAAQSPARAYLIDVTEPADHARGLATFSFMAGLGGAIGYAIGGVPWGTASDDDPVSLQVRVVFGIVLAIFVVAVMLTITAEKEKTLYELFPQERRRKVMEKLRKQEHYEELGSDRRPSLNDPEKMEMDIFKGKQKTYGSNVPNPEMVTTLADPRKAVLKADPEPELSLVNGGPVPSCPDPSLPGEKGEGDSDLSEENSAECDWDDDPPRITMGTYLMSIVFMPWSLRVLCLTHLLGWMSLLCYSLYFTDFVGQAVYGGNPTASPGSEERDIYAKGVRMGSFAMAIYSMTCSICSFNVDRIIAKIGAKPVYIFNHLIYSLSMVILANVRTVWATFVFSACAGIQYSTLFTLPFVILAHYHSSNMFESSGPSEDKANKRHVRGLGTDIALVQGMVFVAQLILSSCMGSIVQAFDSTVAVIVVASVLSFLGAIFASQVTYAGL